jgi:hypothetical protein
MLVFYLARPSTGTIKMIRSGEVKLAKLYAANIDRSLVWISESLDISLAVSIHAVAGY